MGLFDCCFGRNTPQRPNNNILQTPPMASSSSIASLSVSQPRKVASDAGEAVVRNVFAEAQAAAIARFDHSGREAGQPLEHTAKSQAAITHVAQISTVGAFHPNELYESFERDERGELINTVYSEQGLKFEKEIELYRNAASKQHDIQLESLAAQGITLSEEAQTAQLAKHIVAVIKEKAETLQPDQLPTNCYEKALLAFDFAAGQPDHPQLDVVGIARGLPRTTIHPLTLEKVFSPRGPDHTVLAMGRDPNTDIQDPTSWNPDTLLCDASKQRTYTLSDLADPASGIVTGMKRAPFYFDPVISLAANCEYDPSPSSLHLPLGTAPALPSAETVQLGDYNLEDYAAEYSKNDEGGTFF